MSSNIPRIKRGDKITASFLNLLAKEVERQGKIAVPPGVNMRSNAAGYQMSLNRREWFYARITGGNNPYSWKEYLPWASEESPNYSVVQEVAGRYGTIDTDTTTASSPAYEVNGNSSIAVNTIVRMTKAPGYSEYLFQYSPCY